MNKSVWHKCRISFRELSRFWHIKSMIVVENSLWVPYFHKTLRIMKEFQSSGAYGCATLTVTKNQFIMLSAEKEIREWTKQTLSKKLKAKNGKEMSSEEWMYISFSLSLSLSLSISLLYIIWHHIQKKVLKV